MPLALGLTYFRIRVKGCKWGGVLVGVCGAYIYGVGGSSGCHSVMVLGRCVEVDRPHVY